MPANYDSLDLIHTWNQDLAIGHDNDLADTSNDEIQSLIQEVQTIVNSDLLDWEENPTYAASLDDYIGEPNSRDTASSIVNRITTSLISNNIVRADDVSVRVIPVGKSEILIIVSIQALATQNNSIIDNNNIVVTFSFDYSEEGISIIEKMET